MKKDQISILLHPQEDIGDFIMFTGLVRYLATTEKLKFIILKQYKDTIKLHYNDIENIEYIVIEKYEKSDVITQLLHQSLRNIKKRHIIGNFDIFRLDKYKGVYTNQKNPNDLYSLYGFDPEIMKSYFKVNRNIQKEENILKNIFMISKTDFSIFTSCEHIPTRFKINCFGIYLDKMFSKLLFMHSICIVEVSKRIYLYSSSKFTLFIYLMHHKYNVCNDKQVVVVNDNNPDSYVFTLNYPDDWIISD